MDRNYCFRRKRHSYAACDAALAASKVYNNENRVDLLTIAVEIVEFFYSDVPYHGCLIREA